MESFTGHRKSDQVPVYSYTKERSGMLQIVNTQETEGDVLINSPAHYETGRTIEPIEIIEDWHLNHHLACALKYISRAGRKHDEIKDLKKAVWYVQRRIRLLEQRQT